MKVFEFGKEQSDLILIQMVDSHGVFESPDIFFNEHKQTWNLVKDFAYVHYGRKVMNRNVSRIRHLAG